MKSYQGPSFQDRMNRAAEAKKKALEGFRARPPLDEKVVAERQARRLQREARQAEKRAAREAAAAAAASEGTRETSSTAAAPPTEAERKLARDARYAARKAASRRG